MVWKCASDPLHIGPDSRQEIWRKGETSGNVQRVVSITADCDGDALVVEVVKSGPACHTGAESCFFNPVYLSSELKAFSWQGLYRLIEGRKTEPRQGSYTSYLFEKGKEKILKKVGEECTGRDGLRDQRPCLPCPGADGPGRHHGGGHHP